MERLGDWVVIAMENIPHLRESLERLDAAKVPFAAVNAELVVSRLQLAAAAHRLTAYAPHLRTKSIHSELLLCLSPSKNIGEALKRFSCTGDESTCVIVMHKPSSDVITTVTSELKGGVVPLVQIERLCNPARVETVYGVTKIELATCGLCSAVVNRIAVCDI